MRILPLSRKSLPPFGLALVIFSQSIAFALGQQCIGCQPVSTVAVAVRTHLSVQALLYQQPVPPAPRTPIHVQEAVYRAPTRLPVTDSVPSAPVGSVRARVFATWPGNDAWVDRVVSCESGYHPDEIGGGGGNYFGLFQMGPWARARYGNPLRQTIEQQTVAAWRLLVDEGSSQWACSPWDYHPHG